MNSDPVERRRQKAKSRQAGLSNRGGIVIFGLFLIPVAAFGFSLTAALQGTPPSDLILTPSTWALLTLGFMATILLNGIFVAAETSVDLLKNSHLKLEDNDSKIQRLNTLIHGRQSYAAAAFMGSMTMRAWMVLLCVIPAKGLADMMNSGWLTVLEAAVLISIPVAGFNVVFGELIPKSYAAANPSKTALKLFNLYRVFATVFWVPTKLAGIVAGSITKRFGADASFSTADRAEEEIKSLIETYSESGDIEEEEIEMLGSVFDFGDTVAREIMTPRVDLDSVSASFDLHEAARMIVETGHSRLPVYEGSDDQILGVVHAKDILTAVVSGKGSTQLIKLMRPAIFVPENKGLHDLLDEMRIQRTQMVVVQDEFGGTAGIVTIEDIVEEVMGEIIDEYDDEEPPIVKVEDGWLVEGRLHLDDVNDEIDSAFQSDEFDTLGGYLFGLFGRQPGEKETIEVPGYRLTIVETDGRRIVRVQVEPIDNLPTVGDEESA